MYLESYRERINNMKTLLFISLAVLAGAQIISAQGAIDYFPLHVGDYWVQHTDTISGEYQPTTFRREIEGIDLIGGEEHFRLRETLSPDDGPDEWVWYSWMRVDPTGIVIAGLCDTSIVDSAIIIDPPVLWVSNEIVNLGYTWEFYSYELDGHFAFSVESISEAVQVPAGTFNDCILIRLIVIDTSGDTTQISNLYYAQGVGEVLNTGSSTWYFGDYQLELVEYSVQTFIDGEGIIEIPDHFHLLQNYPNPFNQITTIMYGLPWDSKVTLRVFTTLGREVTILVDEHQEAGGYKVQFDATGLPSGIYFYNIQAGEFSQTRKLILLK